MTLWLSKSGEKHLPKFKKYFVIVNTFINPNKLDYETGLL